MRTPFLVRSAMLLGIVAALAGCKNARINAANGYIVDEALVASIQPGVDNRESVARTLGRPTWTAQFDKGEWYYVSRNTTQIAFLTPKVTGESIIIVSFDPQGTVTAIQRDGMDKIVSVKMEGDKTPTKGKDSTLFDDIFGNIGRFGGSGGAGAPPGPGGPN